MTFGSVLILGDSYSAYEGWIPKNYHPYYGDHKEYAPTVDSVEKMWWHMLIRETGSALVQNNSWSGAPLATVQYGTFAPQASYSTRIREIMQNGKCDGKNVDTVFVFGGTNDDWGDTKRGEIRYDGITEDDLKTVFPALIDVILYLRKTAPQTRIIVLINCDLKPALIDGMAEICEHLGVEYIKFTGIDKEGGHPTAKGMEQIKEQILEGLQ